MNDGDGPYIHPDKKSASEPPIENKGTTWEDVPQDFPLDFSMGRKIHEKAVKKTKEFFHGKPNNVDEYQPTSAAEHVKNALWIITAAFLFRFLDIPKVVLSDHRVKQNVLVAGVICMGLFLLISVHHVVWLSWIRRIKETEWEKVSPLGVPTATFCALLGSILFIVSFWGVWSVFTPLIFFAFLIPFVIILSYF